MSEPIYLSQAFYFGILGGMLAELLGFFKLRHTAPEKLPIWVKSRVYWIITLLMVIAGGILAYVYEQSGMTLKPLIALNVGASAPLIIGSLVANAPKYEPTVD